MEVKKNSPSTPIAARLAECLLIRHLSREMEWQASCKMNLSTLALDR
jgi:hypothetical protein